MDLKEFEKEFATLGNDYKTKDDEEYYVQMAEAWLISYLGIYAPQKTFDYIKGCPLKYNIIGKGIQKICDSFRVSDEWKEKFKSLRK